MMTAWMHRLRRRTPIPTLTVAFPLKGFNLLPYRDTQALSRRYRYRGEFALAALLGLMVAIIVQYGSWRSINQRLFNEKALERTLIELQPKLAASKRLNAQLAMHQQRAVAVSALQAQRNALAMTLIELGRIKSKAFTRQPPAFLVDKTKPVRVVITTLKYQPDAIMLSGEAINQAALNDWVLLFKRSKQFASVEVAQIQRQVRRIAAPRSNPNAYQRDTAAPLGISPFGISFSLHLVFPEEDDFKTLYPRLRAVA